VRVITPAPLAGVHRDRVIAKRVKVEPALALDDEAAASIVERGYAERVGAGARCSSLPVAVPADTPPIAALACGA
jgi:hypothetical protein